MKRPGRITRILKWTGTIGCVLLMAAIALSGWRKCGIEWCEPNRPDEDRRTQGIGLSGGCIGLFRMGLPRPEVPEWSGVRTFYQSQYGPTPAFESVVIPFVADNSIHIPDWGTVVIPLWGPLALLLFVTAFLWRRDRRPPPGHCPRCRYNLTGNTSGVCSECGLSGITAGSSNSASKKL